MDRYETLDPQDWEATKRVAHEAIDDAIDYLQTIAESPVWQPLPDEVRSKFKSELPVAEEDLSDIYESYKQDVLPYALGNTHPRFWAWYMGNGTITGALADFLTSVMNSNAGAGNHVGQAIEDQVIKWMKDIMGYPDSASGILVSGGSMANYVGLSVARHIKAGYDIRTEGLRAADKQFTVYASTEVHSCNQKAVELLGIGSAYLRKIKTNVDYTINLQQLEGKIKDDIAAGYQPIAIIASAGTVNTGAIDDMVGISRICKIYNCWMHVDGAIGAIAMLSEIARPQLDGISLSDSVAMDLHKWMHVPFESGCILVRDREQHRSTFLLTPEYLQQNTRGVASGQNWYSEYGLQLSRRLRALKVWMTMREYGTDKLGRMITRNIDQAKYLEKMIEASDKLELMAPVGLDIVCYRYKNVADKDCNALNKEILMLLNERGLAVPSYTTLQGVYCLRVAISNHRSTYEDFDFLIDKTIAIGDEVAAQF